MYKATLHEVGGSIMLAVPPRLLELLGLRAGATVGVVFDGRRLVIEPNPRPRYTLDELLAQCDPSAEPIAGDRAWLDDEAVGSELL